MLGSTTPMMLAIDGGATTFTWLRGWPVISMPSSTWTSCGITASSGCGCSARAGLGRRGIVGLARRAQDRRLRLERIDAVERPQQREDDVAVVHRIGDRRGKRLPERLRGAADREEPWRKFQEPRTENRCGQARLWFSGSSVLGRPSPPSAASPVAIAVGTVGRDWPCWRRSECRRLRPRWEFSCASARRRRGLRRLRRIVGVRCRDRRRARHRRRRCAARRRRWSRGGPNRSSARRRVRAVGEQRRRARGRLRRDRGYRDARRRRVGGRLGRRRLVCAAARSPLGG